MPFEGIYAVIVAAGRGERLGAEVNKVLLPIAGRTALLRSLDAFAACARVRGAVVVAAEGEMERCREEVNRSQMNVIAVVKGGATRLYSVRHGLDALPVDAHIVLIHDAARPFVTREAIEACIDSALEHGSGVAGHTLTDTVRAVGPDGIVCGLPERDTLRAVQTPQCFRADWLRDAYRRAVDEGWESTDDIGVIMGAGYTARVVETDRSNIKITVREDLAYAQALLGGGMRVGQGYDVHRLAEGRRLVLCGVTIPFEKGLKGHSDADVAVHALMDALLGAAGLGDIGLNYPDTDGRYKDISSMLMLEDTMRMIRDEGYAVSNADITIIAQKPKLSQYREAMRDSIAAALNCEAVNIKMTTTEGLGFAGRGEGIAAMAAVMIKG